MQAALDVICTPTYLPAGSRDLSWLTMKSQPRLVAELKTGQYPAGVRPERPPASFPGAWRNLHLSLLKPLKRTHLKALRFLPRPWGLCRAAFFLFLLESSLLHLAVYKHTLNTHLYVYKRSICLFLNAHFAF